MKTSNKTHLDKKILTFIKSIKACGIPCKLRITKLFVFIKCQTQDYNLILNLND